MSKVTKIETQYCKPVIEDYEEPSAELCLRCMNSTFKGLVGVYVDDSKITKIDGENGKLIYRGYTLEELVENSTFEEVAFLLIYGHLPIKIRI